MKITDEELQVIYSALGCLSNEKNGSLTSTLVECAKQIVGMHMSNEIEIDVNYNDGLLQMIKPKKGKVE
tara:strand:- start:691 stop:897 length:207 start_codon:yes stop_codon:yes gene_type:complete